MKHLCICDFRKRQKPIHQLVSVASRFVESPCYQGLVHCMHENVILVQKFVNNFCHQGLHWSIA